jgi:exonuclease SbcC
LKTAEKAENTAKDKFTRLDEAWQSAVLAQDRAMEEYRQAQAVYLQGIGSVLAQRLVSGQPCPVCGSCSHPAPAVASEGHITEQQLDALTQAMNDANDAAAVALRRRSEGEQLLREAVEQANQARQAEAVARQDLEHACRGKMPGIDTEQALEQSIQVLETRIREFAEADAAAMQALQTARADHRAAAAELETAGEELTAAQSAYALLLAQWEEALRGADFATEEAYLACDLLPREKQKRTADLLTFQGDLTRAEQQLQKQRMQLAGKTAPDLSAIKKQQTEGENQLKTLETQRILAQKQTEIMESDCCSLKKRLEKHDAARMKVDGDLEFANRLRGRSGISLQRYVLGVMLTAITVEANRLLSGVYSGRYRLYRTDEIAGASRKGGLELEVYDAHNHQRRSVTTLSGGEKFLVALSLAIGLSAVVQAQGNGLRLEAMFIDEGFGSLDREAVGDALDVLQGIRKSTGIVGIISHVEALSESIPTKIEIQKGENGSRCIVRC